MPTGTGWREAARITLASSGARTPGVDGVDKRMMEGNLQQELATMREELLAGSYQPATSASRVHSEDKRKTQATRYPKSTGPNCATCNADGDGADMGERFPSRRPMAFGLRVAYTMRFAR